jgi:hypothetical protein
MTEPLCIICNCFYTSTTKINACRTRYPTAGEIGAVACVCPLLIQVIPRHTLKMEVPGFYETLAPVCQTTLQQDLCLGCDAVYSGKGVRHQTAEDHIVSDRPLNTVFLV